ncbi:hypothetical protein FXO37_19190 [Capsicum annuum]|nr:hypothetical protein FXO37_19190 [Capsicum annuum]
MVNWKVVKPKPRYEDLVDDMFSKSKKLSKDKYLAISSIDRSEPRVSLDKDKVVPNVKMKNADKSSVAGEEKLSLSNSDLDDIKSYIKTYIAQYPVHEGEKGVPNREWDSPQSLNEHKTDAKSDNVVHDAGQSSKVGGNEGAAEECLKESEEDLHNKNEGLCKAITIYILPSSAVYQTGITDIVIAAIDTRDRQGNTDS